MVGNIKEFIYPKNSNLSFEESLRIINRSSHNNSPHQYIFSRIDSIAKDIVKDLHNLHRGDLFDSNGLNVLADLPTIENTIISGLKTRGHEIKNIANPEILYRTFRFIKPSTLLPSFNYKLKLIEQVGLSETDEEKAYLLNPYFFAFKISFDIYINSLIGYQYDEELPSGLLQILVDKYGEEFGLIYHLVANVAEDARQEVIRKREEKDETLIEEVRGISGIDNKPIFNRFIYETAMITGRRNAEDLNHLLS